MSLEMRASDADRQRVIDALQQHTAAGRLSLEEFSERVGDAYSARTLADLAAITRDLPTEAPAAQGPQPVRRELLAVFAVAAVTLVLLVFLMALR